MQHTRAGAAAAEKVQTAARKAGHGWNQHCTSFVEANIDAAIKRRQPRVMVEYGGLRARHDLVYGTDNTVKVATHLTKVADDDGADVRNSASAPASATTHQPVPQQPAPVPAVQEQDAAAAAAAKTERDAKIAQTARERRQRQKAAAKGRREAKRELVSKYASEPYGTHDAPMTKVKAELWSSTMDLKMGFTKIVGEVTHRCATEAREHGLHTKEVELRFGGVPYSAAVLSGRAAVTMTATERSTDLLMLLSEGLTEGRLTKLLRRWSKHQSGQAGTERSMDAEAEDDDYGCGQ